MGIYGFSAIIVQLVSDTKNIFFFYTEEFEILKKWWKTLTVDEAV